MNLSEEEILAFDEAVPGLGAVIQQLSSRLPASPFVAEGEGVKREGDELVGVELLQVADDDPTAVDVTKSDAGSSSKAARVDHKHQIPVAAPSRGVGAGNMGGTSNAVSRADHGHALHESGGTDLKMGPIPDRTVIMRQGSALVGIPFFTKSPPLPVTKSDGKAGTSEDVARADHKHDVASDMPGQLSIGAQAKEGDSTAMALADHVHEVPPPTDVQLVSAREGDAGEMTTFAREDHAHQVLVAKASPVGIGCSEGKSNALARADHGHSLVEAGGAELALGDIKDGEVVQRSGDKLVGAQAAVIGETLPSPALAYNEKIGDDESAGKSSEAARADHAHVVKTGKPVAAGRGNGEGASELLARADHSHSIFIDGAEVTMGNVPDGHFIARDGKKLVGKPVVQLAPRETKPQPVDAGHVFGGVSELASRADHKHSVPVGKAGAIGIGDEATEGNEAALSRADHGHQLAAPGTPSTLKKGQSWAGQSTKVAREDHRHDIATGKAVAIGKGNYEGEAETFARSDHGHALKDAGGNELTLGAIGNNQLIRRVGDKLVGTEAGDVIAPADYRDGAIPVLAEGTKQLRASAITVDSDDRLHAPGLVADVITALKSLAVKGKLVVGAGASIFGRVVLGPGPEKDAGKSAVAIMGKAGEDGLLVYADGKALDIRSMTGEPLLVVKGERVHVGSIAVNKELTASVFADLSHKPIPGNYFGAHYQTVERKLSVSAVGNVWADVATLKTDKISDGEYRIGWQFAATGAYTVRVIAGGRELIQPCSQAGGFTSLSLEAGVHEVKVLVQSKGRSAVKVSHGSIEFWRVK